MDSMRRFRRRPSDAFHGAGVINESSDAGGREFIVGYQEEQRRRKEQTTARILLTGQPLADCGFNLAALHPAYPIKSRTSRQRT